PTTFMYYQAEDGIRDRNVTGVQTCALPIFPARVDDIAGSRWRGTGLDTGHPMFATLGEMRWWGKDFTDPRKVDPILVTDESGEVVTDTSATGGGGASLWEVSFRDRPTASLVYDRLPVIDHVGVVT